MNKFTHHRGACRAWDSFYPPFKPFRTVSNKYRVKFICSKSSKMQRYTNPQIPFPVLTLWTLIGVTWHCKSGHKEHLPHFFVPWAEFVSWDKLLRVAFISVSSSADNEMNTNRNQWLTCIFKYWKDLFLFFLFCSWGELLTVQVTFSVSHATAELDRKAIFCSTLCQA